MTTDLSATFDLVDHNLLINKLKFFGINNNAAQILTDFLGNRKIFTEIQGFRSRTKIAPPCSVIQGSKLLGFLFTVFTIEIPLLPKLLKERQYTERLLEIQIPTFSGVNHAIGQYVDDSTNIVDCTNNNERELYLTKYHELIEKFYMANKLNINSEKS